MSECLTVQIMTGLGWFLLPVVLYLCATRKEP